MRTGLSDVSDGVPISDLDLGEATSPASRAAVEGDEPAAAWSLVIQAIELTGWLHAQQLELADLRQDLVDEWIAAGSGCVAVSGCSSAGWRGRASSAGSTSSGATDFRPVRRSPMSSASRSSADCCTTRTSISVIGSSSVLLLYGKPITKIAKLRATDLETTSDGTTPCGSAAGRPRYPTARDDRARPARPALQAR